MMIATRRLMLQSDNGPVPIDIDLHAPRQMSEKEWRCTYEIAWPDGKIERWGAGVDSVQALLLTLQMVGTELYASEFHQDGRLVWEEPGIGYGFPVPNNIRDLLIGEDRRYL